MTFPAQFAGLPGGGVQLADFNGGPQFQTLPYHYDNGSGNGGVHTLPFPTQPGNSHHCCCCDGEDQQTGDNANPSQTGPTNQNQSISRILQLVGQLLSLLGGMFGGGSNGSGNGSAQIVPLGNAPTTQQQQPALTTV